MVIKSRIFGHPYVIRIFDGVSEKAQERFGKPYRGWCEFAAHEIWVESQFGPEFTAETILHELLEAINYGLELGLPHNKIQSIALAYYTVLADNKKLRDALFNELNKATQ
jgi:hypothetical protein